MTLGSGFLLINEGRKFLGNLIVAGRPGVIKHGGVFDILGLPVGRVSFSAALKL